jgi:hypothetical protein
MPPKPLKAVTIKIKLKKIEDRWRITSVDPLVARARPDQDITWTVTPEDATVKVKVTNFRLKTRSGPFTTNPVFRGKTCTKTIGRPKECLEAAGTYKYDVVLGNGERLDPEIMIYDAN